MGLQSAHGVIQARPAERRRSARFRSRRRTCDDFGREARVGSQNEHAIVFRVLFDLIAIDGETVAVGEEATSA
jgi:hypothetical protein